MFEVGECIVYCPCIGRCEGSHRLSYAEQWASFNMNNTSPALNVFRLWRFSRNRQEFHEMNNRKGQFYNLIVCSNRHQTIKRQMNWIILWSISVVRSPPGNRRLCIPSGISSRNWFIFPSRTSQNMNDLARRSVASNHHPIESNGKYQILHREIPNICFALCVHDISRHEHFPQCSK